ncbi:MAG TPA: hypothetical protein VKY74_18595 [Chloroflexia bacterium]|nr:hypothetical protein [Chloroflexia bacterium]
METPTGTWLAELILSHLDELAATLGEAARRDIPLYRAMEPAVVHPLFAALYQVLAQTLAAGDMAPMRTYLQHVTVSRIRDGAAAASFIKLAEISDATVDRLVQRELPHDPAFAAEALRQVHTVSQNVRLILSEINLQLLSQRPPSSPAT